jgi:hypothetical protein
VERGPVSDHPMKSFFKRIRGRTAVRRFALLLPATLILIAATAFARPAWEKHRSAKASRNQSGRAAVKEFLVSPAKAGPPPLFTQLDTDGDGLLSPWEIEWATESLRAMDRNEDGWIENSRSFDTPDAMDKPALLRQRTHRLRGIIHHRHRTVSTTLTADRPSATARLQLAKTAYKRQKSLAVRSFST